LRSHFQYQIQKFVFRFILRLSLVVQINIRAELSPTSGQSTVAPPEGHLFHHQTAVQSAWSSITWTIQQEDRLSHLTIMLTTIRNKAFLLPLSIVTQVLIHSRE